MPTYRRDSCGTLQDITLDLFIQFDNMLWNHTYGKALACMKRLTCQKIKQLSMWKKLTCLVLNIFNVSLVFESG